MRETPYLLDAAHRELVLSAILETADHNRWRLLAAHVRTNHVHGNSIRCAAGINNERHESVRIALFKQGDY